MSMGLHSAREELGLPNVAASHGMALSSTGYMSGDVGQQIGGLPKPISLSPRTFGMEDLRDFCGPVGTFKTGLTPRVFSTGLTPRSGFTPRFTTGFTPRINVNGLSQAPNAPPTETQSAFMNRPGAGYSPRGGADANNNKISPSGFTPKDVSGAKVPMRFPGAFSNNSPPKMPMGDHPYKQEPAPPQSHLQQMQQIHQHTQQMNHGAQHHGHMPHPGMPNMNMPMYDYMNRPALQQPADPRLSVTPNSDRVSDQEDLDERRRMKNRERVRKCRKRKQDRLNFLEDRTAELEKENGMLKAKMARKDSGAKDEPMTEAQLNDLRKKQNTTLSSYIRAYNEVDGSAFESSARGIWADNAEILYGSSGARVAGMNDIVASKKSSASVFSKYEIKQYTVQWMPNSTDKCLVTWEVEVSVKKEAAKNVPLTAPFAELAPHYGGSNEPLSFQMISRITFEEGKITEEIRQLNLSRIGEKALKQFAEDPKKAADVLRCLMVAA
ncbi:hypothetical protein PHYSODRAFT_284177 [Phytophthora sojae]|uniref:BZIP domain-containing protein n=1 Tax=Phytophthora sojae (strain P6497) TaxID=1094619 RepID=G4YFX7_PHYSP|nr:hypothetical protein PHYSODRAFT_284177 [Phytophthora sojae]EGZ28026.1 hypothetical protein PHYSODRAFT_284177 [Phytophthora sojae]|eukprot:XP_009515301.1 hypothetical protein PHYSODRAFT_284177 [Phytophthora sojae]